MEFSSFKKEVAINLYMICTFIFIINFYHLHSDGKTQELKSRLMKIASSGENGVHQEQCLNRNAKLVLAATGSVNKFAVPPKIKSPTEGKSKLYSMHIAQQMAPQVKKLWKWREIIKVLKYQYFKTVFND